MARSMCTCGAQVLWKADEPQSDEWLLVAKPDLPDDLDHVTLLGVSRQCAFCSACGRLWVAWDDGSALTEYVPADASARPVSRPGR